LLLLLLASTASVTVAAFGMIPSLLPSTRTKTTRLFQIAAQQLGTFESLDDLASIQQQDKRTVRLYNLAGSPPIPFGPVWEWQKQLVQQQHDRISQETARNLKTNTTTSSQFDLATTGTDLILMLQHAPVYTLGTASSEEYLLVNNHNNKNDDDHDKKDSSNNVEIVRMDRGGEVTYHGPGQLVVYPVLHLEENSYRKDVHWYMRALEEVILRALYKVGLTQATRLDDVTGVWIHDQKVAALGIKLKKWVTMHGLAVNVEPCSLANFDGIVPCGLEGRKVACINDFLLPEQQLTVAEFANYMKEALEEVFMITLVEDDVVDHYELRRRLL
jgi:lipoyl(octanoyl) transferase